MKLTRRSGATVVAWSTAAVLGAAVFSGFAMAGPSTSAPAPAPARAPGVQPQAAESASPSASPSRQPRPSASASARPSRSGEPKPRPSDDQRRRQGHRVLHGETVVQTDNGTAIHVVQRGIVTAMTSTSLTVRSADGFTLTWTRDANTRIRTAPKGQEQRPLRVGDDVMARGVRRNASTVLASQVHVVLEGENGERPRRSPSPAA